VAEGAYVEEFLHTLGLKWKCRHCSFTKNLTIRGEAPPNACENIECRALHSYEKVIRCKQSTVRGHRGRLRVFFGWLKDVEKSVEINPLAAPKRMKKKKGWRQKTNTLTIQYYEWDVIDALLKGIEEPNTPAEEAMVLYLLLHHAFYMGELQTIRIPKQCRPIALGVEPHQRLEDILGLEWQHRELSRSRQSLGRTGEMLHMEPTDEPWLRDLVKRFIRERNQKLRNPNNPYLFVGCRRSPRSGHVGAEYFRLLVESATARLTGRVCTVNILGKCSRLLYSEFGGYEAFHHLRELGLGETSARTYAWAKRVMVVPKQAGLHPGKKR
jgi:integrase